MLLLSLSPYPEALWEGPWAWLLVSCKQSVGLLPPHQGSLLLRHKLMNPGGAMHPSCCPVRLWLEAVAYDTYPSPDYLVDNCAGLCLPPKDPGATYCTQVCVQILGLWVFESMSESQGPGSMPESWGSFSLCVQVCMWVLRCFRVDF